MLQITKHEHPESYVTNSTFLLKEGTSIFSDNEKGELVVTMDKLWVVSEEFLSEELKQQLFNAAKSAL